MPKDTCKNEKPPDHVTVNYVEMLNCSNAHTAA